jgi:hypothetical protein
MILALRALTAAFALACATPALAGGPVEILREDLPKPIAKLHTCLPPGGMTSWRPTPERAGNAGVVISVSCPIEGSGVGARRLTFPYLNPDGSMTTLNVLPRVPTIGWTTKGSVDKRYGNLGVFDRDRWRRPNNAFHLSINFAPADRPHLTNVIAVWQIDNGEISLIYWAETTETLRGREPNWTYPQYKTVLDLRPES